MPCNKSKCSNQYRSLQYQHARRVKRERRQIEEELGPAPCPWCGHQLVTRVGKGGPYFFCGCARKKG